MRSVEFWFGAGSQTWHTVVSSTGMQPWYYCTCCGDEIITLLYTAPAVPDGKEPRATELPRAQATLCKIDARG